MLYLAHILYYYCSFLHERNINLKFFKPSKNTILYLSHPHFTISIYQTLSATQPRFPGVCPAGKCISREKQAKSPPNDADKLLGICQRRVDGGPRRSAAGLSRARPGPMLKTVTDRWFGNPRPRYPFSNLCVVNSLVDADAEKVEQQWERSDKRWASRVIYFLLLDCEGIVPFRDVDLR